jgi:hypothetical protein
LKKVLRTEEIKQKIELIHKTFEELQKLKDQSKDELSLIDRELSNQYHNIEGVEIDYMSESHIMMMKLKDILYQRREAKVNHTLLESFITAMERSMEKTKKRYHEIQEKHQEIIQEIKDRSKKPE